MSVITAWLGLLALSALGVAIWTGRYRSWVHGSRRWYFGALLSPWGAVMFGILGAKTLVGLILERFGTSVPSEVFEIPGVIAMIIGLSAATIHHPRWALPPWFRELLDGPSREGETRRDR